MSTTKTRRTSTKLSLWLEVRYHERTAPVLCLLYMLAAVAFANSSWSNQRINPGSLCKEHAFFGRWSVRKKFVGTVTNFCIERLCKATTSADGGVSVFQTFSSMMVLDSRFFFGPKSLSKERWVMADLQQVLSLPHLWDIVIHGDQERSSVIVTVSRLVGSNKHAGGSWALLCGLVFGRGTLGDFDNSCHAPSEVKKMEREKLEKPCKWSVSKIIPSLVSDSDLEIPRYILNAIATTTSFAKYREYVSWLPIKKCWSPGNCGVPQPLIVLITINWCICCRW